MSIPRAALLACMTVGATACGDEVSPPTAAPAVSVPVTAPPVAAPSVETPPSIPRADVDALLSTWLGAQNTGDFDAYAALYATRFGGVRRTARAAFRLDHDGWIADRRRIFGRRMHVEANDVEVVLTATTVLVHLQQRWESGGYAEEGEKRMVLVRERGALRISSEEMVAAHTVPAGTASVGEVLPALDAESSTLIVLGEALGGGEGAPRSAGSEAYFIAVRDADVSIPRAFAGLVGTHVQLVGSTGICSVTVTSLANAAIVEPEFDTAARWLGRDYDERGHHHAPVAPDRIAAEIEAMAERHYWVAVADASTCGHARAAVLGDPPPIVWPLVHRAATRAAVLALIFSGDTRRELIDRQRDNLVEMRAVGPTDDATLEARLSEPMVVREWARPGRASVIEADIQIEGWCNGEERTFFFTRTGDVLVPRDIEGFQVIEDVIDVEDDGTPELLMTSRFSGGGRITRLGAAPTTLGEWRPSLFGCGC